MKIILFGILAALIISCEGATDIKFYLKNSSSSTLTVYYSRNDQGSNLDTTIVLVGESFTLYEFNLLGGNENKLSAVEFLDTLVVVNATMDTMQKDFSQTPNWQDYVQELKKFPSSYKHEYTLEVKDADF